MTRIAVLDDWQRVARTSADWSALEGRGDVVFFEDPFADLDAAASALAGFDALIVMRERTPFPARIERSAAGTCRAAASSSASVSSDVAAVE